MNYRHACPNWDFLTIDQDDDEYECCTCNIDSDGNGPGFHTGERVYVAPLKMEATVVKQRLHYDGPESFWGDLELLYDDGLSGASHCWQVTKVKNES